MNQNIGDSTSKDFDKFWGELSRKFVPTPEELEVEAGGDSDEPLSECEIESIVQKVTSDKPTRISG